MAGVRALTDKEFSTVLGHLETRDRTWCKLMYYTGFRISEVLCLRRKNVILGGRVGSEIDVPRRYVKKKRRGQNARLHKEAKMMLHVWLKILEDIGYQHESDFVFQNAKNKNEPITRIYAYQLISAAARKSGIFGRIGTHSIRKNFAQWLRKQRGIELEHVTLALNHSSPQSTIEYLEEMKDDVNKAILTR